MWSAHELIVAPATVAGVGARAIVRIAGDGTEALLRRIFVPMGVELPRPGESPRVVPGRLADEGLGRDWGELPVDVLFWPGPGGPIGGPLAEVQLPASAPLVDAVIAEACRLGARLARGGEFTLRGFLTGRLDLVQAEAVLAVVDARTPEDLSAALDRMAGGAGRALNHVRGELLDLLADIEASIDFADEATPDAVPVTPAWRTVAARLDGCRRSLDEVARSLVGRDATAADVPRVVLVGRPNIGKSSLFNALVGRDAALVADESGTTRDWIEARVSGDLGREWLLVDLAGLDASAACEDDLIASADILPESMVASMRASSASRSAHLPRANVTRSRRGSHQYPTYFISGVGGIVFELLTGMFNSFIMASKRPRTSSAASRPRMTSR